MPRLEGKKIAFLVAQEGIEQVDWDDVRRRTSESPFARAFFEIVDGLGITAEPAGHSGGAAPFAPRRAPRSSS